MKKLYRKHKTIYDWGKYYLNHPEIVKTKEISKTETLKLPLRSDIINFLLNKFDINNTFYLEIGVRNPDDNFNKIQASKKYSVDPGIEYKENPVDFKVTSDDFFEGLDAGSFLNQNIKFDVIFIDGLHLAEQVERDINNSLRFLKEDGFLVLHDCNPPTEWHSRYNYSFELSPAWYYWNGSTWKAFVEFRKRKDYYSCCIDSDWGVGIISKKINFGSANNIENKFYEYDVLNENRKKCLNLISYNNFKTFIEVSK